MQTQVLSATEVTRRFLAAYGPASEAEMAAWLGMAPADARPFVDALRPEMEPVTIDRSDGRPRWRRVGERTVPHPPPATPTLLLLPPPDRRPKLNR